jgi:hypothetical protein
LMDINRPAKWLLGYTVSKAFRALLVVVFAIPLTAAQSNATEAAKKFNWRKCMAWETSAGLNRWSAARRCAKVRRNREH